MSLFGAYAHYYDLLYKDKDYAAEAEYVSRLLQQYAPEAKSVLELGCGTGIHAHLLAKRGYALHGVDRSPEMLESARKKTVSANPRFSLGDIRSIRIKNQFNAVISLFHVMSYQTTDEDLNAAFATAKTHLCPGGIFIFDCWYGPAVLSQKPAVSVKRFDDEQVQILRIAEPEMRPADNAVDVNYHVIVRDKASSKIEELRETHSMRYLFTPEVESFLLQHGLKPLDSFAWMSGKKPGLDTWGVCFVAKG